MASLADLPCCCAVAKVIEQRCFNTTPNLFNGQTVNFILKPLKGIELVLKKPIWSAIETKLICYFGDSATGQVWPQEKT